MFVLRVMKRPEKTAPKELKKAVIGMGEGLFKASGLGRQPEAVPTRPLGRQLEAVPTRPLGRQLEAVPMRPLFIGS
jgi:hypothetical protein